MPTCPSTFRSDSVSNYRYRIPIGAPIVVGSPSKGNKSGRATPQSVPIQHGTPFLLIRLQETAIMIPNSSTQTEDLGKAELVLIQRIFEGQSVETRGRLPKEGTVTNHIYLVIFEWPASKSELGRH